MALNHRPWKAHTVGNVGRGMTSPPMDTIHGRTMSGVTCHHRLWTAHTVKRHRAWHAIIAIGKHRRSYDVRRGMPSPPLDSTHDRTTSGVACHHIPWTANTIERRRAWNAIIAFGQHTRLNNVGRGMPSSRWEAHTVERSRAWHAIIALRQHTRSNDIGRGMPSSP